jgi:CubicO group peptidase (beta-lactamase class C family)
MMKTDQTPLNIEAAISPKDDLKNHGWTFGYSIKRKDIGTDPVPVGTISWGGSTGPIFFIDLKHDIVAMFMCQTPSTYPLQVRSDFRSWVMKSIFK